MFVTRCSYDRSASVSRTTWFRSTMARVDCRLRANVSRLRTILAARSDSLRMVSRPRLVFSSISEGGRCDSRSAQRQNRGERVVQLVRDARNRLAERRELFGLQQLVVQVARLVFELLALADVAHERVDADAIHPAPADRRGPSLRPRQASCRRAAAAADSR